MHGMHAAIVDVYTIRTASEHVSLQIQSDCYYQVTYSGSCNDTSVDMVYEHGGKHWAVCSQD